MLVKAAIAPSVNGELVQRGVVGVAGASVEGAAVFKTSDLAANG
jgi:hypothetical protein